MTKNNNLKRIISFSMIAIMCGWFGVLIDSVLTQQPEGQSLGMLLWLVIPYIFAIGFNWEYRKTDLFGLGIHFKGNGKQYILAFFLFPAIFGLTLLIGMLTGIVTVSENSLATIVTAFVGILIQSIIKNIFEETSWRGFLTENLLKQDMNDWLLYGIVVLVWGTWHIPYYIFFLKLENPLSTILWNYLILLCWTILYTEIYRRVHSVWPCILLHAFANSLYAVYGFVKFNDNVGSLLLSADQGVISMLICLVTGLLLRHNRIKKHKEVVYDNKQFE